MKSSERKSDPGSDPGFGITAFATASIPRFRNRKAAAIELVDQLEEWKKLPGVLVLALSRGGVPIGFRVAAELKAPLDMLLVEEVRRGKNILGGSSSRGCVERDYDTITKLGLSNEEFGQIESIAVEGLRKRERLYRGERPQASIENRYVIIVDDGSATEWSIREALAEVRTKNPIEVIVALPVGRSDSLAALHPIPDRIICLMKFGSMESCAECYEDFPPVSDLLVRALLRGAWERESVLTEGAELPAGADSRHGWET